MNLLVKIKITKTNKTKIFYVVAFFIAVVYMLLIRTELYESRTALLVKELGVSSPANSLGLSLLGGGPTSQLQDSKVVEEYLHSVDIFLELDEKFSLVKHYKSDDYDLVQRLRESATLEDALAFYHSKLTVEHDEISGILHIAYAHVDAKKAQEVLQFLISRVEDQINLMNKTQENLKLKFVKQEFEKNKQKMKDSARILEEYQNKHLLLDPMSAAQNSTAIISSLESTLTQKKIELSTKEAYLNKENYEIVNLKNEIEEIKYNINDSKKGLSGNNKERLNKVLFEFEQLKLAFDLDIEIYKNSLITLETTRIDASKQAKVLSIISKPNRPDGYTYPNKSKAFITLLILTLLSYGIFSMLGAIIKDHKE